MSCLHELFYPTVENVRGYNMNVTTKMVQAVCKKVHHDLIAEGVSGRELRQNGQKRQGKENDAK